MLKTTLDLMRLFISILPWPIKILSYCVVVFSFIYPTVVMIIITYILIRRLLISYVLKLWQDETNLGIKHVHLVDKNQNDIDIRNHDIYNWDALGVMAPIGAYNSQGLSKNVEINEMVLSSIKRDDVTTSHLDRAMYESNHRMQEPKRKMEMSVKWDWVREQHKLTSISGKVNVNDHDILTFIDVTRVIYEEPSTVLGKIVEKGDLLDYAYRFKLMICEKIINDYDKTFMTTYNHQSRKFRLHLPTLHAASAIAWPVLENYYFNSKFKHPSQVGFYRPFDSYLFVRTYINYVMSVITSDSSFVMDAETISVLAEELIWNFLRMKNEAPPMFTVLNDGSFKKMIDDKKYIPKTLNWKYHNLDFSNVTVGLSGKNTSGH